MSSWYAQVVTCALVPVYISDMPWNGAGPRRSFCRAPPFGAIRFRIIFKLLKIKKIYRWHEPCDGCLVLPDQELSSDPHLL